MDIRVPTIAEGVESGTVVAVAVKVGDAVKEGDTVVELETNKAVATIPATGSGKVTKIHVKEGDSVPVGGVLVSLDGAGSAPSASPAPAAPPTKTEAPKAAPAQAPVSQAAPAASVPAPAPKTSSAFPPPASPSIRKMAQDLGIDLTRVHGSEAGGRINLADLRNYIAGLQQMSQPSGSASAPAVKTALPSVNFGKWGPVEKKPMTQLRRTISKAMTDSWDRVPRITQFDDIDISHIMSLRKKFVDDYEKAGARLTVTSFVIKAIAQTLVKNPVFNTSIDETTNEVVYKKYYHLGIAVDTEHGLMVPVLRDADKKDLLQISKELHELAEKTRSRKIGLEEMQGGSFTISNQGGIGGKYFTPMINLPETAIIGLGRAYAVPVYTKEKIEKRMVMPIGLSYDHRVIDGAKAAKFVVDFAEQVNAFTDKDVILAKKPPAAASKTKKKGK